MKMHLGGQEIALADKTGIWVLMIHCDNGWIRLRPEMVIASGYYEGEEDFKRMLIGKGSEERLESYSWAGFSSVGASASAFASFFFRPFGASTTTKLRKVVAWLTVLPRTSFRFCSPLFLGV